MFVSTDISLTLHMYSVVERQFYYGPYPWKGKYVVPYFSNTFLFIESTMQ